MTTWSSAKYNVNSLWSSDNDGETLVEACLSIIPMQNLNTFWERYVFFSRIVKSYIFWIFQFCLTSKINQDIMSVIKQTISSSLTILFITYFIDCYAIDSWLNGFFHFTFYINHLNLKFLCHTFHYNKKKM